MPKFRTFYDLDESNRVTSPTGSPIAEKTGWINKDGELHHVVKETFSLYEKIQAARDSVDLKKILERYENGDDSALNRVQGSYFDLVSLPKTYAEMFEAVHTANETFDRLPIELREKYKNSASYFWSKVGSSELDRDINDYRTAIYKRNGLVDTDPSNLSERFAQSTVSDISSDSVTNKEVSSSES